MCSPGRATAILPSRHAPLQSLQYGSDVGGWSSGKSSFSSPKHKSSVRCMRRATPMPFVATRRHRAMIRQWRKDPLARPRPYFPCRRSSSVAGDEREGRVSTIATCLCACTAGARSTPGPGLFEPSTAQQAAQKRMKRGSVALSLTTIDPPPSM